MPKKFFLYKQLLSFCVLFCFATSCSIIDAFSSTKPAATSEANSGYSALALFLENQEQLKTLRSVRSFLTREQMSKESEELIDSISEYSSQALVELKTQTSKQPTITITQFSDNSIGMSTFDSMRMSTAKQLMFDSKNFEKNLLLSQTQILKLISHLAEELRKQERNKKRKVWLSDLSRRHEDYFTRVYQRIALT